MNINQTLDYLRHQLHWPIPELSPEDLTFEYDADELGLKPDQAQKLADSKILQLRPLPDAPRQPFGIFLIQFSQAKLPIVLLRRILNALVIKKRKTQERHYWNPADLLFISTFQPDEQPPTPQPDDPNLLFAHFHQNPKTKETPTLRVLGWNGDDTKLKTDYIKETLATRLQWPNNPADTNHWRQQWTQPFQHQPYHVIRTAKQLAQKLAELAQNVRDAILALMDGESEQGKLRQLHKAFRAALISDLTPKDFADAYAQTIAYGLLTIAITKPDNTAALSQDQLHDLAPIANPFLRQMLTAFLHANGKSGKLNFDELGVQNIVELLQSDQTDLQAILRDFGRRRQDPALHFYEDFLRCYDPKTKFQRGVFYTPQPVVNYIVRNLHESLQNDFGLPDGLADTITWGEMVAKTPGLKLPPKTCFEGETETIDPREEFIKILDPATGTGTFLVTIIDWIYNHLTAKWKAEGKTDSERKAAWQNYVPNHLLPRLYGYEIMMAPYAVAHMKISLKLQETGYQFTGKEGRVHIYLTNALEPPMKQFKLPDFEPLAHEAQAVNEVKKNSSFTVLTGNPPYSVKSKNQGKWISQQIRDHYYPNDEIKERKLTLSDDYVKFFRFSQYTLSRIGVGLIGHITNHGFIDNVTFRRMRQSLLESFSRLQVLDLHGNARKRETAPDGSKDQNVFDIQQGVAITIGVNHPAVPKSIQRAELYGLRESKETALDQPQNPTHSQLKPSKPFHLFIPQNETLTKEYEEGWKVNEIFPLRLYGLLTNRDAITIHKSKEKLWQVVQDFARLSESEVRLKYDLGKDSVNWKVKWAQEDVRESGPSKDKIQSILYRPFDIRWTYYTGKSGGFVCRPSKEVMKHMISGFNLGLVTVRQLAKGEFNHAIASSTITESCLATGGKGYSQLFPLYLYHGEAGAGEMMEEKRRPNFSPRFLAALAKSITNESIPNYESENYELGKGKELRIPNESITNAEKGTGREKGKTEDSSFVIPNSSLNSLNISPEDVFGYMYAILHSPEYRRRYRDFLRIDFPRIPLPKSLDLFRQLANLGRQLVSYHLMTHPKLQSIEDVQHFGHRQVVKVGWTKDNGGTVWLDGHGHRANFRKGTSGFAPVPEDVWKHHVGGYQVCEKWLKDRAVKKSQPPRLLSDEEVLHYRRIVAVLSATIQIMREIDKAIHSHSNFAGDFVDG